MTKNNQSLKEDVGANQSRELAKAMNHWLVLFEERFSAQSIPLSKRPMQALLLLLDMEAVKVSNDGEILSSTEFSSDQCQQSWFRACYDAVEFWYQEQYGAAAMTVKEDKPLVGVIMIRGVPFLLSGPANRTKLEEENEKAWIYFEEGLGEGEKAVSWIIDGPDLSKLGDNEQKTIFAKATRVAETLRYIEFRTVMFSTNDDLEVQNLIQSTLNYLEQAARHLVSQDSSKIGPAWFDLQMTNETALKAIIRKETGSQPFIHSLDRLLEAASEHRVKFDPLLLADWPNFNDISNWRYGQGNPLGTIELYEAYMMTLELVHSCMQQIVPAMKSGFGVLIKYKPWSARNAAGNYRSENN